MDVCEISESYERLREQALKRRATELGLTRLPGRPVWGVVMETCHSGVIDTVVATDDGTLSLLTSTGDVVQHAKGEWPYEAGARLIGDAGDYLFECVPTWAYPKPDPGKIRFYLLTHSGTVAAEALEAELAAGGEALSPLFYAGHDVLTLARLVSEDPDWASFETMLGDIDDDDDEPVADRCDARPGDAQPVAVDGPEAQAPTPAAAPAAEAQAPAPAAEAAPAEAAPAAAPPAEASATAEPAEAEAPPAEAPPAGPPARSALVQAAMKDDIDKVAVLLARGHDMAADSRGLTPLMAAAYVGAVDSLRLLLAAGAPVEIQDGHGFTALMFACNAGRIECARLLVETGGNVEARDAEGCTPLMFASQHGHDDIVRLLLNRGADPNKVGDRGLSAVGFATKNGLTETVAILLGQET